MIGLRGIRAIRRNTLAGVVAIAALTTMFAGFVAGTTASARAALLPPTMVQLSGPQGGPFAGGTTTVSFTNPAAHTIVWGVRQNPAWGTFSQVFGTLPASASSSVSVSINSAVANLLPPGAYNADLLYRTAPGQPAGMLARVTLTVEPQNSSLIVTPSTAFEASGPTGGPIAPQTMTYSLTNAGSSQLAWALTSTTGWVGAQGSPSGTLAPGSATNVTLQLNAALVNALPAGTHAAQVRFERAGDGALLASRSVNLTIQSSSNDEGWTEFTPSSDTRRVYVSNSSGSDANNGLSESAPKRSLASAKALMRHGYPDWLLLKKGDTWTESLGQWNASGRSASEPMLISTYGSGTQRPLLRTGNSNGISSLYSSSTPTRNHIAIVGIHFQAHTYTGSGEPAGVAWLIESTGLLVEDCRFEGYQINVSVPGWGGRKRDIKIRRNVIEDAFATSGTVGHGIYLANCDNVLIEDNVLDHNGWKEGVPGAVPSIFRHGIYVQSGSGYCTGVVVRGNIIADSSSHGLHMRSGGVVENNLFLRNSIALSLGGGNEPTAGGVTVLAKGNVILDGKNIDGANPRGWGIDMANISSGNVSYNIVANHTVGAMPVPMTIYGDINGIGVHQTVIERNIFRNWRGAVSVRGNGTQLTNITLRHNDFMGGTSTDQLWAHHSTSSHSAFTSSFNRFYSLASSGSWMQNGGQALSLAGWKTLVGDTTSSTLPTTAYPNPDRTIATYHQSMGGAASHAAFIAQAVLQSKSNWREGYTAEAVIAYVRAGFGMTVP